MANIGQIWSPWTILVLVQFDEKEIGDGDYEDADKVCWQACQAFWELFSVLLKGLFDFQPFRFGFLYGY